MIRRTGNNVRLIACGVYSARRAYFILPSKRACVKSTVVKSEVTPADHGGFKNSARLFFIRIFKVKSRPSAGSSFQMHQSRKKTCRMELEKSRNMLSALRCPPNTKERRGSVLLFLQSFHSHCYRQTVSRFGPKANSEQREKQTVVQTEGKRVPETENR